MAATWTIGLENGQMQTLADLNISDLKITFRNRAADEARFRIDGDYTTAGAGFAYGSVYKIAKNGTVVYRGRCEKRVRHGSGADQYANVVLLGGWHWLTLKMLQQNWPMGAAGTPTAKTRVILGAKYNATTGENEMVSASAQLADIIASAPSAITRGTIAVSNHHIPLDERVDSTCAQAVDAILSWWPDAVAYFRYGAGSQVNIKRVGSLSTKTIPIASLAEEVEITARNDLCVPGVKLVYETTDENGCQSVHVDSQNAGDSDALGGVVNTISVAGASPGSWDITSVKITSERLPDPLTAAWWASRIPQLTGWSDVTLHGPNDTVTLSDGTTVPGRTVTLSDGTAATTWPPRMGTKTLHSELLGGTVEPWMKEKVDRVKIQQYVDYTLNGQVIENALLSIEMTLTSAETKIYQTGKVSPPPEDYPSADGLAREIHEAAGKLYYEGSIVQIGEDPPDLASVGDKINISGGAPEWTHMDTPVQLVEWDVDRGMTRVSFGPPNHVGKQDQAARGRANSKRGPARSCGVMGRSSTADESISTGATGSVNTSAGGGTPAKITVVSNKLYEGTVANGKVEIDAKTNADQPEIRLEGGKNDFFESGGGSAKLTDHSLSFKDGHGTEVIRLDADNGNKPKIQIDFGTAHVVLICNNSGVPASLRIYNNSGGSVQISDNGSISLEDGQGHSSTISASAYTGNVVGVQTSSGSKTLVFQAGILQSVV